MSGGADEDEDRLNWQRERDVSDQLVTPGDESPPRFCSYCRTELFSADAGSDLCVLCIERTMERPAPETWPLDDGGSLIGGYLADVPEPHVWRHATGRGHYGRRHVRASVMKHGLNPHFYVRIEEENDEVWNAARGCWQSPYGVEDSEESRWTTMWWRGRSIDNPNYDGFIRVEDAQEYLSKTLREVFPAATHEVDFVANGDAWGKVTWKEGD